MNTKTLTTLMMAGLAFTVPFTHMAQDRPTPEQIRELEERHRKDQEARAKADAAAEKEAPKNPAPQTRTAPPSQNSVKPLIPLSAPPQNLRDENGNFELDLVDPFQRQTVRKTEDGEIDENGLSATSLGEISEEFKILAIIMPYEEGGREPMALIRLKNESSPQVVKKDDLIQIQRRQEERRPPTRRRTPSSEESSFAESALNALEGYSFYLHIKEIQPTYIEAYQKKSPNETIILRW